MLLDFRQLTYILIFTITPISSQALPLYFNIVPVPICDAYHFILHVPKLCLLSGTSKVSIRSGSQLYTMTCTLLHTMVLRVFDVVSIVALPQHHDYNLLYSERRDARQTSFNQGADIAIHDNIVTLDST